MKRTVQSLLVFLFSSSLLADDKTTDASSYVQSWGLASTFRNTTIPYRTSENDTLLNSYLLLGYLQTPHFFIDGTEAGFRFICTPEWKLEAVGRQHFVDLPRHDEYYFSDIAVDLGGRLRYENASGIRVDLELLTDMGWRPRANVRLSSGFESSGWYLRPYAEAGWKSSEYNTFYYGMDRETVFADVSYSAGAEGRYRIAGDIYLFGEADLTYLGANVADANTIEDPVQTELIFGAGVYQTDAPASYKNRFDPKGYLRFSVGEATPSSFTENITGGGSRDLNGLYMVSLFYGYPLSRSLFGVSIHSYFSPGFAHHFDHDLQKPAQEYIGAFKFYYRPESWWLRFGFGTGMSYITDVTYIERYINEKDGYDHTSNLMQYLDFSFDFDLKHLFGESWRDLWFGYALHHRSGVFESAHHYGQIKGGSNYNTFYLQYHFENN